MHKIALQLGNFSVHWYGVLVALGFMAGLWTAGRRATLRGFSAEKVVDLGPWIIVGAIIGARTLYVFSYWEERFAHEPWTEIFMVQHGGLVFYGGLIGSSLATILYTYVKKLPLWQMADIFAPSIALGHVFGRVGCLMNGCCYGQATDAPWAIHFPPDHETHGAGLHPTQIYESSLNFALYLGLAWLYRRKKFDGQVFAVYLAAYAGLRTVVELFRGDYKVHYVGGLLTPAQLVSAGILLAAAVLWWKLPRPTAAATR